MSNNNRIGLFLFSIVLFASNCFCQNFEPTDPQVVNTEVNYEVNYYVSNGNYSSVRILTDGILLKYVKRNGHIKICFIRNKKLDYYHFLKIQLFIDSVVWKNDSIQPKLKSIQILGLPETIQILQTESLESRIYPLKYMESETIVTLSRLMNNYIPKRYRKKISVPVRT